MKKVVWTVAVIVIIVLVGYLALSVSVKQVLSPKEFVRFSKVVVKATILHRRGGEAINLAKEALRQGKYGETIALGNTLFIYTLPNYTTGFPDSNGVINHYATFSNDTELYEYFHKELPEQGWEFTDQLGALYVFKKQDAKLAIIKKYYLTTGISELHVSVSKVSN